MDKTNEMKKNPFVQYGKTKVVEGSILQPELSGLRLIMVPMGEPQKDVKYDLAQFPLYKTLERKWKQSRSEAKGWRAEGVGFKLGNIKTTLVQSDTWLVHCLMYNADGTLDEKAFTSCLKKVADLAKAEKASVHVSAMVVEAMPQLTEVLKTQFVETGTSVYFYNEPKPAQVE
jgi:hypothetical protein